MTNGAELWQSKGLKRQLLLVLLVGTGFLLLLVGGIIAIDRLFGTSLRFSNAFILFGMVFTLIVGAHRGGMTHVKQERDRQEPGSPDMQTTDSREERPTFQFMFTALVLGIISVLGIGMAWGSYVGHEPGF
jgi:hypothetical protein